MTALYQRIENSSFIGFYQGCLEKWGEFMQNIPISLLKGGEVLALSPQKQQGWCCKWHSLSPHPEKASDAEDSRSPPRPTQGSADSLIISFREDFACFYGYKVWIRQVPGDVLLDSPSDFTESLSRRYLITRGSLQSHTEALDREAVGPLQPSNSASPNSPQYYLLGFVKVLMKGVVKAGVLGSQVDFTRQETFWRTHFVKK